MSMLAEPRRKQKWTLNPRGKQWSDDPNKFGQKMLEKMGWTSGKGLGANEQGTTEHVRVSLKNDTSGIGFKNDNLDKAWTEHQDGFNSILQQLQESQDDSIVQVEVKTESGEKSLELKSKQSRARVHYHKFTRGKDVKRYSSKDLANIFGQKELNGTENTNGNVNNDQENFDSDPLGKQENRGGVITIHGGSMADYFSKKGQNVSLTPKRKMRQASTSESEPEYAGFGFASTPIQSSNDTKETKETEGSSNYAFENPCLQLNSPENISNTNSELKSSKKRKISNDYELSINDDCKDLKTHIKDGYKNAFVNPALNLESTNDEVYNGKEFEVSRTQFGVANSALDIKDEVIKKKRVTFNDHIEYSTDCVKKKKKKKAKAMLDKFEVENKKSKKKKKRDNVNSFASSGIINEALDVEEVSEEINDNEINERKSSRPKKRKNNYRLSFQTIMEIPEEDQEADHEIVAKRLKVDENAIEDAKEDLPNKKGKKKKKKEKAEGEMKTINENIKIENVKEEDNRETEVESCKEVDDTSTEQENEIKVKEKKKKKKKGKKGSERNDEIDETVNDDGIETNSVECMEQETIKTEETVKIKKNKQKKTKDVDKCDINIDVDIKSEKEISDKENKTHNFVNISTEEKPKKEKHKESVEVSEKSTHTMEPENVECAKVTQNTNISYTTWRSNKFYRPHPRNIRYETSRSRNPKTITSKNVLTSLLHRKSVAHFPGANVDEIKGYGNNIHNKE